MTCLECRFFNPIRERKVYGHCIALPPLTLISGFPANENDWVHPVVCGATMGCGLFSPFSPVEQFAPLHEAVALRHEIEVLRRLGNKDCTGMADSFLEAEAKGEVPDYP